MPRYIRCVCIALLAVTLGGCSRRVSQYSIEDFLATTSIRLGSFSHDGRKVLITSNETGVFNAFAVDLETGARRQLTFSDSDAVSAYSYFPSDERFIYGSDQGGNELTHLYVRGVDGSTTDLSPGENLKAGFAGWAHDDRSFFMISNERDRRYFDVFEVATEGYGRSPFFQNEEGYNLGAVSRDKRYVALTKSRTTFDRDIYLHDRTTGATRLLTSHEGAIDHRPEDFTPDGTGLLYLTDEDREFRYLAIMDLNGEGRQTLLAPPWDVSSAGFSKKGDYLLVRINRDARTQIELYRWPSMNPVRMPNTRNLNIGSVRFSRDESELAFMAGDSRSPADLFHAPIGGRRARRLTETLNPRIDSRDLVEGEVVRFSSYDGITIPGILYRPHRAGRANKVPALVWVHGGPGGQSRIGYSGSIQHLVNHGYAVYAINNRGSSGYGKTFYKMDDLKHGDADLDDCVASKQMLIDTGYVDPDRIGIYGGSYGGYMVLAALTFRPEEFAVGVDLFGISNWIRTLESIPPWWEARREALYLELGDPAAQRDYLRGISPLFHATNIRRPLMVLQGANDPRVLKVESDEIVAAARANGVAVDYVVFDDEGHGFRKKVNRLRAGRSTLEFLDRHLKGGSR